MLLAFITALLLLLAFGSSQALAQDSEQIDVPTGKVQSVDWNRLAGSNRLDTMAKISSTGFDSADTVIIANAYNFPDALSATSLAGYYQAPVLLTGSDSLDTQTATEIKRLGATKAIIAGGDAVISNTTKDEISALDGMESVSRVSGAGRYDTSYEIYKAQKDNWSKTAIVASGEGFADALSISPYVYATNSPIFLSSTTGLTDDIKSAITSGNFEHVVIVGGDAVISPSIENYLADKLGENNVERLAGATRYDTSAKIVKWCVDEGTLNYEDLAIAYGENFPDALAGGAFCGFTDSVLLLVNEGNYQSAVDTLSKNASAIKRAYVFGGGGVISNNLYNKFQEATLEESDDTDTLQAFAVYCKDDQSLNFYKRKSVPEAGSIFNGKTATKVFSGIEDMAGYSYSQDKGYEGVPGWSVLYETITTVNIVDDGIKPNNMDLWFGALYYGKATSADDPCISQSALETINGLDKIDTSSTTSMKNTFCYSQKLKTVDIANWDVSKVEDFSWCFDFTKFDSLDLSKWVTSSAKNMSGMFSSCGGTNGLNLDLSKFDTSKVENMYGMFWTSGIKSITGIDNWNTSNVKDMNVMFSSCKNLTTLDLSKWNTSNVTNMHRMFSFCSSLANLNLSNWDTSKVTNMEQMFNGCSKLAGINGITKWNISSVTDMSGMFYNCSSLTNLDLSNWDTSKVTDMGSMFYGCSKLAGINGITNWNTSKVTDMSLMFYNCTALTADCSKWDVDKVTQKTAFNYNAPGVVSPNF